MRVFLTGASGFLGTACIARMLSDGIEIHALSRQKRSDSQVEWHVADLMDEPSVTDVLQRVRPSHLLHLAWDVSSERYWSDPANLEWVVASIGLLERFGSVGGSRVVMVGSCAEYSPSSTPCSEFMTPTRPDTIYGASKAALSTLLPSFALSYGVASCAWARLFYVYGPREAAHRVMPTAIRTLSRNERLICEAGVEQRDYIYVDDAADALIRLLLSDVKGELNIGTGDAVATRTMINEIAMQLHATDRVEFVPKPTSGPMPDFVVADTTRIRSELSWSSSTTHTEGIRRYLEWYREGGDAKR